MTSAPALAAAAPGAIVTFGAYPQTAVGADRTPIRWRVLDRSGGALYLLSELVLDCRRWHRAAVATTWRDCDLRRWLGRDFLAAAFDDRERARIRITTCADNGVGSPVTRDRVFLPSVAELRALTDPGDGPRRRRTYATAQARVRRADGCHLYVYDKGVERDYVVDDDGRHGCSWWWTRTQLQIAHGRSARAAFIGARSNIKSYGAIELARCGVRPAIKLRLP